jgi:hypothetical protein
MAQVIRVQPRPNTYRIDNIIVDEYGEKIGAIGIAVYNVLARHADRQTGVCWPYIDTIAKKLKLGRTTVKKYLRILQQYALIAISPRYTDKGDAAANCYIVLDPTPEKMALRRLQRERLVNGYYASANHNPQGGQSPGDLPPYPSATDPQSPADHFEQDPREQKSSEQTTRLCPPEEKTSFRQTTCPHPESEVHTLSDGITLCHHCYGLVRYESGGVSQQDTRAA